MKFKEPLLLAFVLSLCAHLFFGLGLKWVGPGPVAVREKKAIEVEMLSQKASQEHNRLETGKQIVEQNKKSFNEDIPKDAKFLSLNNQKVVKETRAQKHGDFSNDAGQSQDKGRAPTPEVQARTNQKKKASKVEQVLNGPTDTENGLPTLARLKPSFHFSNAETPSEESVTNPSQDSGAEASKTSDYLKEVATGAQTLLNTREFVYFSYYNRIREKLRQQWEPRIREKVRHVIKSGRSIASARDRITKVVIILSENGSLERVQVISESGITDLDEAAVDAFRAAEPFPNPPKGIIESDGKIRIKWEFILEARITEGPQHIS